MTSDYVKFCEGLEKVDMTIEKILQMRNGTNTCYVDFIEFFISAVIGKNKYKENKCDKLLLEFVSIGDEALAILIFENNFETWKDMAAKGISKNSEVSRKYTNG